VSGLLHVPAALPPAGERAPGTHWLGDWVGPRTGLDDVEERKSSSLLGLKLLPLGRPAFSQSLHQLQYPGSEVPAYNCFIISATDPGPS
jgi:hypothetical protein